MATVYGLPQGFDAPNIGDFLDGGFDVTGMQKAENEFIDRLAAHARHLNGSTSNLIGEVVSWGHADGAAQYMVWKERPLTLIHLPLGDGYQLPAAHERGLRVGEIRQQVKQHREAKLRQLGVENWWASLDIGTVLHYHNGFKEYVRGEIVDGEWNDWGDMRSGRVFMPKALVGEWPHHAAHHIKRIIDKEPWRPSTTCIFEHPEFNQRDGLGDVRTLPELDLNSL